MVIYILTKFDDDWLIFVDDKSVNKKIVDGINKIRVKAIFLVSEKVENILEKGENAGNQHFLLRPYCFQNALLFRMVKLIE